MLTFFAWFNLELEYLFHSSALKMYRQRFDHYSLVEDSILYVIKRTPKSCEKIKTLDSSGVIGSFGLIA